MGCSLSVWCHLSFIATQELHNNITKTTEESVITSVSHLYQTSGGGDKNDPYWASIHLYSFFLSESCFTAVFVPKVGCYILERSTESITGLTCRDKQPFTHTHSYRQFGVTNQPDQHVFRQVEHANSTKNGSCPVRELIQELPCCEATALTTAPSCSLNHIKKDFSLKWGGDGTWS